MYSYYYLFTSLLVYLKLLSTYDLYNKLCVLQNSAGGTPSLRLAVDGHVILHHTPSNSQVCSGMIC